MKIFVKMLLIIIGVIGLTGLWYFADDSDYFSTDYKDITTEQQNLFKWQDGDDGEILMEKYRQHFADTTYFFPRQKVSVVKLFKNIPLIGVFTSKTLKKEQINNFVKFCNDSANFDWGETTWGLSESEYYFKLYNLEGKVVGKIYFMLSEQPMTESRPFCPSMKFGGLSNRGFIWINELIKNHNNWE